MTENQPRRNFTKPILACVSVAIAALNAWKLQPWYHSSDDAVSVLITVFSILTGFLAAVMAIVANDRVLRGRNWRQDTFYLELIRGELALYKLIFYLYLMVLILAFLTSLEAQWPDCVQLWLERVLIFSASLGILSSFHLPEIISRKHIQAMEHQIRTRRDKETGSKK
ncbi:hypothetical protein HaloA020_35120 [Halomonas sp. A020]|uniref:hypothetical protein n=1 Tax=Halomonas sp. A020 TaxID=2717374 RepID=UPI0024901592|nr:hypothetical protein [Halomonas sp. A020]BCB62811.1 hypothetical protein HaloA020_35120 [Halomonas sp. A020]